MNVRNCRKCGRIFNYVMGPLTCPACREEQEKKFQEVKKYVQDNHHVGISDIVNECGVDASQVQQWIREERLVFADDSPIRINCEKCGAMIKTGRFCENCKNEMARGLNNAFAKPEAVKEEKPATGRDANSRMRFL